MEYSAITRNCDENTGSVMNRSKNLQIRLLGHCIICLRKASRKWTGTSDFPGGAGSGTPEVAPKLVVSTPGFLATFNQVWTVLQSKWKERNTATKDGNGLSDQNEISLENVLQNANCVSANVSFSRAPTICRYCCDKVLVVENLMKAVRQQVREINTLLEEGRRRQDGGLGEFEKRLRVEGLEESVIRATLQFVGVFESSCFQDDDLEAMDHGHLRSANSQDENAAKVDNQVDSDDDEDNEEGQMISGDEIDDDGDPDYVKEEPEESDNGGESTDDEDASEEEMEVDDEEDKNDPAFQVEKDPLELFLEKRSDKPCPPKRRRNQFGSSKDQAEKKDKKYLCTCGKKFASRKGRSEHVRLNKNNHPIHPEFRTHGNRQTCDLCGEWIMYNDILEHLTDVHLNGQGEWVTSCPNEKCRFKCATAKAFHLHVRKADSKGCHKLWKEKCGPVCDICGFKGTNMLKIRCHVRDKHENGKEKKWKCPISGCGKMFFVKQSVHYDLSEHRYQPPITQQNCDKCGKDLKVEEMEGHLREEHAIEEVIGCQQCNFKFSGRDEMAEHLYEHRVSGIRCDICGEDRFARYVDFRKHYFEIHKLCPKKYRCGEGECDTWFWRKEIRKDHEMRAHKQVKNVNEGKCEKVKIKCDMCDIEYTKEEYLMRHKIRVHGADPFGCDICGETFDDRRILLKHKKEHAGVEFQKEWKCEVEGCGKTFKKKTYWKHHLEVGHGGEKRHVCEICGKGFAFPQGLKNHRNAVHLGLKPYICEHCGEKFGAGTTLKTHKLIHSEERKFGCEICLQSFRYKSVLGTHLNGHEEKGEQFKPNGPMKQLRKRKAVE